MPKCDFSKAALQLYSNHTSAWVFSCEFASYFQNIFLKEHLWRAASVVRKKISIFLNWELFVKLEAVARTCFVKKVLLNIS